MIPDPTRPPKVTRDLFFTLKTAEDVAALLEMDYQLLSRLIYVFPAENRYRQFRIKKKNGDFRQIASPIFSLKKVQWALAAILHVVFKPAESIHGFVLGRSIITNAQQHLRQHNVLNVDLKDFFPSINFGRVRGMFMANYNLPPEPATVLAQICCFENELPQGAPTSPVVSNMICQRLDRELERLAYAQDCVYTRYADDLTFSTSDSIFPPRLARVTKTGSRRINLGDQLIDIIESNGFDINLEKFRLQGINERQIVTGIVVNRKLNVRRKYIRQIRAMLHAWKKFGLEAAEHEFHNNHDKKHRRLIFTKRRLTTREFMKILEEDPWKIPENRIKFLPHREVPDSQKNNDESHGSYVISESQRYKPPFKHVLHGKIEFLGSVRGKDDPIYIRFWNQFVNLAPEFGSEKSLHHDDSQIPLIHTEGKTDWKHLKAALSWFKSQGKYKNLNLRFDEDENARGDQELFKQLKHTTRYGSSVLTIYLFDRDNKSIVKNVLDGDNDFHKWGDNDYALVLPVPKHRRKTPEICIEFLYINPDLIRQDSQGRRIFLSTEFHNPSLRHKKQTNLNSIDRNMFKGPQPKIVSDEVFNAQNANVALSKNDFADNILKRAPNFTDIDFSPFTAVFDFISQIIDEWSADQLNSQDN